MFPFVNLIIGLFILSWFRFNEIVLLLLPELSIDIKLPVLLLLLPDNVISIRLPVNALLLVVSSNAFPPVIVLASNVIPLESLSVELWLIYKHLVLLLLFGVKEAPKILRNISDIFIKIRNSADEFKHEIMYSDMKAEADEKEMQQNAQYSIDEIDNDSKIDQNNQKEGLDVEKSWFFKK